MLFLSLFLLGGIAGKMLPLEFLPNVDFPNIYIQFPYPNSTPKEVEELITIPVEEVLGTMSDVRELQSDSDENGVGIEMEFDWGEEGCQECNRESGVESRRGINGSCLIQKIVLKIHGIFP